MTLLVAYTNPMMDRGLEEDKLNGLGTDYLSSSDEEDADMGPYRRSKPTQPTSQIIAEAQRLLFTQESRVEHDTDSSRNCIKTTIEVNGILMKRITTSESFEKRKKSVRFDMNENTTHEYDLDATDSLSSLSLDDGAFIANVLDASDLLASDSELSEDDCSDSAATRERVRFAFTDDDVTDDKDPKNRSTSFDSIASRDLELPALPNNYNHTGSTIEEMVKAKSHLQQEITDMKAEYEAEMKRLSEEYEVRRENYLTELDELRNKVDDKSDLDDNNNIESMKTLEQNNNLVDAREQELEKRRKQSSEQEQEINEYEKYLNRRQSSMNDKEEDLNTLQDELEEFARLLRKRERDLKEKSERIDNEYNAPLQPKACSHDDKEIEELREKVKQLQNNLLKTRIEVEKKEGASLELENKLKTVETENKKLLTKVKNLESQLLLDKKINEAKEECNQVRRSSVMALSNYSVQRLNSPKHGRAPPARGAQLRPPLSGSMLSTDSAFFNSPVKSKITEENEADIQVTHRIDSRSIKSRTCVVM